MSSLHLLLERYAELAHDSMGVLSDSPDGPLGKPWDFSHCIRAFRVDEERVFLEIDTNTERIAGALEGLTGASAHAHPWGTALVLQGPLRWVGTRAVKPRGLTKLLSDILPSFGSWRQTMYDKEWQQIVLILPCSFERAKL